MDKKQKSKSFRPFRSSPAPEAPTTWRTWQVCCQAQWRNSSNNRNGRANQNVSGRQKKEGFPDNHQHIMNLLIFLPFLTLLLLLFRVQKSLHLLIQRTWGNCSVSQERCLNYNSSEWYMVPGFGGSRTGGDCGCHSGDAVIAKGDPTLCHRTSGAVDAAPAWPPLGKHWSRNRNYWIIGLGKLKGAKMTEGERKGAKLPDLEGEEKATESVLILRACGSLS